MPDMHELKKEGLILATFQFIVNNCKQNGKAEGHPMVKSAGVLAASKHREKGRASEGRGPSEPQPQSLASPAALPPKSILTVGPKGNL